jgi:uncharacterized membrane protein
MVLLVFGIGLFALAHFAPAFDVGPRRRSIERFGADGHRGVFSLLVLASVAAIVLGWRAAGAAPVFLYAPPSWSRLAANVGMALVLFLFVASGAPSNVKRFVRHPQLLSVLLWSLVHLLANGDLRSVVLFGGLGAWAVAMIPALNRRDGEWIRPEPRPIAGDVVVVAITGVVFFAVRWAHPYFAGVSAAF